MVRPANGQLVYLFEKAILDCIWCNDTHLWIEFLHQGEEAPVIALLLASLHNLTV